LHLYFEAKDGGSLLRPGYPERLSNLLNYLTNNVTVFDPETNRSMSFNDLQINHKNDLDALKMILKVMSLMSSESGGSSGRSSMLTTLKYPVTQFKNQDFYIGHLMCGITKNPITHAVTEIKTITAHLSSACGNESHLKLMKSWTYRFLKPNEVVDDELLAFWPWNDFLLTKELNRVSQVEKINNCKSM